MNFGRIPQEPILEYHSSGCLSNSKLGDFVAYGPDWWRRRYITKEIKADEDTQATLIGHSSHCLILEGEEAYAKNYAVLPADAPAKPTEAMLKAKNPGEDSLRRQLWWAEWDKKNVGKCVLTAADDQTNRRMLKSLMDHPIASRIVKETQHEVTFRAQAKHFAVQCRFDMISEGCSKELAEFLAANKEAATDLCIRAGSPFGGDFKSTRSLAAFQKQFDDFGYYIQFSYYMGLLDEHFDFCLDDFLVIACETDEPFRVGTYAVDAATVAAGSREVVKNIQRLVQCYETGIWEGSNPKLQPIGLKPWRLRQIAGETENYTGAY